MTSKTFIYAHKRKKWRDFVETLDQKTAVTKLWRTIKRIYGRAKCEAENEVITFNGSCFSSSKQLATRFNTPKLGRYTSSDKTQLVTRETERKSLEVGDGTDIHLKHLGRRAIEYITTLFNLSVETCQI